eukprot:sb/3468638/
MTIMKGGCTSGIGRVLAEACTPRFFHVRCGEYFGGRRVTMTEISLKKCNYTEDDVFILDIGNTVYQINGNNFIFSSGIERNKPRDWLSASQGSNSSHDVRFAAAGNVSKLMVSRGKAQKKIVDGNPFDEAELSGYFKDGEKKEKTPVEFPGNQMFRVSDSDGSLDMDPVDGCSQDLLDATDVFVIDTENHVFVWIGAGRGDLTHMNHYLLYNFVGIPYNLILKTLYIFFPKWNTSISLLRAYFNDHLPKNCRY